MSAPTVSVVVPLYNHAACCGRALRSLQEQTLCAIEIVVVDDGSTDGSARVVAAAARQDPRVRLVRRPHAGIVAALAAGVAAARAPYIARMDADDDCDPSRLERQLARLDSDPGLGAVDCRVRLEEGRVTGEGMRSYVRWLNGLTSWSAIREALFEESPLAHPAVLMRRRALEDAGGYRDDEGPEDYSLWLRMVAAGYRLEKIPEALFAWADPPRRLTRTSPRCTPAAIMRLKAHHLPILHPETRQGVQIWGAGPTGKQFADHLRAAGIGVVRFFDIDPRKIGGLARGVPVLAHTDIGHHGELPTLVALGSRKAKAQVRAWLAARQRAAIFVA